MAIAFDQGPPRLVVVQTDTGQVIRELVPPMPGGGVGDASLDAAHSVVFYTQGLGTCAAEVDAVPLSGGTPHTVVASTVGVAESNVAVRPDRGLIAFSQTHCESRTQVTAVVIASASGAVVSRTRLYRPASGQAWSADGGSLLAVEEDGARGTSGLHELNVTALGSVTGDRLLPAPTGCYFTTALFSPVGAQVVAEMRCGMDSSLVELDPAGDRSFSTLAAAQKGHFLLLGPIDATGRSLLYGTVPYGSGAAAWYVLADGRSRPLSIAPHMTPAGW